MSLKHSLFIKYGLTDAPSELEIEQWLIAVDSFIDKGVDEDRAGELAAKYVFSDYNSMFYASEADDIETLLAAARNRKNNNG